MGRGGRGIERADGLHAVKSAQLAISVEALTAAAAAAAAATHACPP